MLNQECPAGYTFDVIVIDYGCPDGTFEWLKTITDPKLRGVLVVDHGTLFNLNRARNVGARLSSADILFFNDADDLMPLTAMADGLSKLVNGVELVNWTRKFDGLNKPSCFGSVMLYRDVWGVVRGYDENLGCRYGFEDADFYRRVRNDHEYVELPFDGWSSSERTFEEPTRFYETNDYEASKAENSRRIWSRGGIVNPNGFGTADTRIYSPIPEFPGWMSWSELALLRDRASKLKGPATWLEVGVYLGRSFHHTGMALPEGSTLIGVDTFNSRTSNSMPSVYVWKRLGEAIDDLHNRRPDLQIVLTTPNANITLPQVDGLFIDADHSLGGITHDIEKYIPYVKPNGFIGGHDYNKEHYSDLCDVIDRLYPDRKIQHTIWETSKEE